MLKLFLPVIFPSWRFFSSIGPSLRIEVGLITDKNSEPQKWLPFRPLPEKINFTRGLKNLFHNPRWNEQLYINTCAEHLFEDYLEFHEQEIGRRLVDAAWRKEMTPNSTFTYLVFRISTLEAEAGQGRDQVVFVSRPFLLRDMDDKQ